MSCNQFDWQDSRQSQSMFEQLDEPKLAGYESWRQRLVEGVLILAVSMGVIGLLIYAFMAIE